jgi:PAS domain S-box-containing protein
MRQNVKKILKKVDKLSPGQMRHSLVASAKEIDRLETVLDSLPRGILVCDTSHKLLIANKASRRFLSIVSYEYGREMVWSVIPNELVAEFLSRALLSRDKVEEREFDVEVSGVVWLLQISVSPLVQNRQVTGSLVLIEDITERRSREARLRRVENLASLTTLAAGVAHEIKNPLASLSIHVQLIQKTLDAKRKLSEKERSDVKSADDAALGETQNDYFRLVDKYLGVVNEEVDRLNGIVVDFLFAVRPMNADLRYGDINGLIIDLVEFVSLELESAKVKRVLNLADKLPQIKFDSSLMKQALLNLIKNAAAAMPGGGELSITTEAGEGALQIVIADTGTGIPAENLVKIFEPYFTTKDTGSGLGLTLVFKIIKEHQGDITVKSREGEGTVFIITLPLPQAGQRLITYEAPGDAESPEITEN